MKNHSSVCRGTGDGTRSEKHAWRRRNGGSSDRYKQLNNQQGAQMPYLCVLRTSIAQEGKVGGRNDGNFDS